MSTFDELKKAWNELQPSSMEIGKMDNEALFKMIKMKSKKQLNGPMHYFWGAMVLHIILYAILCHIIIVYHDDTRIVIMGIAGCLMYIPFTVMMVRKFSSLAIVKPGKQNEPGSSLKEYVARQKEIIQEFYDFKMKYELFLIPISTAIGVYLFFTIFIPGGVTRYWGSALFTFVVTLGTTVLTILCENRKRFRKPISELQQIIDDFNRED
jgi:Na+-transporting methylmalonyl-CoA/oxaloacetate decarboxylase beta subunit